MRLLLSSDALPHASCAVLGAAARRRALAGLELTLGHGHGARSAPVPCGEATGGVPVVWLHLPAGLAPPMAPGGPGAPGVLVRHAASERPAGRVALVHGSDPEEARRAADWAGRHDAFTAWEVRPGECEPDRWAAVLAVSLPRLAHVRLLGAGPEAQAADATDGTGWLVGRLALAGFGGTAALAPSGPAHLPAWERWLLHARGWGCGTAAEKAAARAAARATPSATPTPTP